jgi:hypothetical protein
MAALRKIVLGLLLVLSLFSSQPSSAQGLKYRGTVGIPFGGSQRQSLTSGSDFVAEIGWTSEWPTRYALFISRFRTNPTSAGSVLVLDQSIPLPFVINNGSDPLMTVTADCRFAFIGVPEANSTTYKVYVLNLSTRGYITIDVPDFRGISNPVGDRFCVSMYPRTVRTYNFNGELLTSITLQTNRWLNYRNFAYYGKSTAHLIHEGGFIPGTFTEFNETGVQTYRSNVFKYDSICNVDSSGQLNVIGHELSESFLRTWTTKRQLIQYSFVPDRFVQDRDVSSIEHNGYVVSSGGQVQKTVGQTVGQKVQRRYCNTVPNIWMGGGINSLEDQAITPNVYGGFISIYLDDINYWDSDGTWVGLRQIVNRGVTPRNLRQNALGEFFFYNVTPYPDVLGPLAKVGSDFTYSVIEENADGKYGRFNIGNQGQFVYGSDIPNLHSVVIEKPFGTTENTSKLSFNPWAFAICPDLTVKVCGISFDYVSIVISTLSKDLSKVLSVTSIPRKNRNNVSMPDISLYKDGGYVISDQDWLYVIDANGSVVQKVQTGFDEYGFDALSSSMDGVIWVTKGYDLGGLTQIYFADPNPPKTSASITSGWYKTNQTIQLSSVDPRPSSGFKALHSVLDTDAEVVGSDPNRTINVLGDGQHKLIYWAEDLDGNIETKNELLVGIDSVPPVVDSVVEGSKFVLLATDDRSGIQTVRYSVDGAADVEYTAEVSLPYGSHEVVYWALDKAGNISTVGKILVGSGFRWKSVYSSPIYAGRLLKATLELNAPAGPNGVTVDVSATDPCLSSVKTITIEAGKTASTLEIPVLGVETDRLVDLSATIGGKSASTSIRVLVPFPSLLSLNPNTLVGGNNTILTVKLPSPAPIGGQTVTLSSNDSRVIVPESVVVAAGQTSLSLPIATKVSSFAYSAVLSARAGGKGSDAILNVGALPLPTFRISPTIVNAGEKSVGVISIPSPAPASGITFKLSTSSQDITVPSEVSIAPGSVRVLFDVVAKSPSLPVSATVSALVDKTKLAAKLSIKPAALKAIKTSSSVFSGEGTLLATVELTGTAPTNGSLISLISNNPNIEVPASVSVPSGSLIANFTINVKEVKSASLATITARSGVVVKFASVSLQPVTVKTVEAVPNSVKGGTQSVLRVELSGKPGPGGITITLSSSKADVASVPASVTVAQGTAIVEVPISTSTVQSATEAVLSARVGTITKQATITVNP